MILVIPSLAPDESKFSPVDSLELQFHNIAMANKDIFLNKYETKEYSKKEEEKAIINLLEDLNIKFQEIDRSNKSLRDSGIATLNILDDYITLNKYIEKESAKTQAILTNMNDGLYVVDFNEKIMLFNSAAEKMFGWTQEEVLGKKDSDIFTKIKFANLATYETGGLSKMIHNTWKQGKTINLSFLSLPQKNNTEVIVSISAAPILDANKNIISGVVTLRDMRHEFEIDRAKTEFVSVASHQLRTPLAAIKWFLELIFDGDAGKITAKQKDFFSQINESTERMIDLVNALLNVSRIETGRIIIDPQPTDLVALTQKTIAEMNPIFEKRKQVFTFIKPKDDIPNINIDPKLVFEVIINLLSNASKYTPEKKSIKLSVEKIDKEVLFKITDTGYGIPAHQQHRIFEKFFRGENIMKHAPEGTGLGLYIVKAIVESSGGRIWFSSEEDRGTTFYFALPLTGSVARTGDKSVELTKRFI